MNFNKTREAQFFVALCALRWNKIILMKLNATREAQFFVALCTLRWNKIILMKLNATREAQFKKVKLLAGDDAC